LNRFNALGPHLNRRYRANADVAVARTRSFNVRAKRPTVGAPRERGVRRQRAHVDSPASNLRTISS